VLRFRISVITDPESQVGLLLCIRRTVQIP